MKYTKKIILENKNNRSGEKRIRYRVRFEGNVVQFFIKYTVDETKWSYETSRCKNGTSHGKYKVSASEINREIQLYEDLTDQIFNETLMARKTISSNDFKDKMNELLGKKTQKDSKTIFDYFDEFVLEQGSLNSWSKATFTKFGAIKRHLQTFDKDLSFETFDEKRFNDFVRYQQSKEAMRLTFESSETGLRNSTILKNIAFVKWFLRWAYTKEHYTGKLHDTFKPRLKSVENKTVIYLTWDELIKLYSLDFYSITENDEPINLEKAKALDRVRDVFCFCCFTSLRYSDVAKLKRSDIKDNHIEVVTKKTNDRLRIELNKYSRTILEKHKYENGTLALPVISNAKMNEQLKVMAMLAGINELITIVYFIGNSRYEDTFPKYELITTHCGRRTFIVNALYLGIPAEVVMSWTGHADYESMKPYIAIVDELKRDSMNKFNQ